MKPESFLPHLRNGFHHEVVCNYVSIGVISSILKYSQLWYIIGHLFKNA